MTKREMFRTQPVLLISTTNPKKKGTMSWDRFENYLNMDWEIEQTVADCLEAGVRMDDIRHDSEHGFILIGEEAIERHKEQKAIDLEIEYEKALALIEARKKAEAEA